MDIHSKLLWLTANRQVFIHDILMIILKRRNVLIANHPTKGIRF